MQLTFAALVESLYTYEGGRGGRGNIDLVKNISFYDCVTDFRLVINKSEVKLLATATT